MSVEPADAELVTLVVARRSERAFRRLYDRHTPYLYRLALRLAGGNEPAAAEMVHDAWVRAVERFTGFEGRSAFRTWLGGFVVNVAREASREYRHEALPDDAPQNDPMLSGLADRMDLEAAVSRLPARQRHVFVLHDLEGWTHEDIALRLEIEPGTSKSQLSRARAALREALEEES